MKKTIASLLAGTAILASGQAALADGHLEEITVAYFLEWPLPMYDAWANGEFEEAMGITLNWVSFETGTAMSAAMASGDVHIAVSQGLPPFVVAASAGQDIEIVDVAVTYSDNQNCVVRADLEIDAENAS
jgi:taurine transport system substrate-binding protein